jgi:hypothetical protein
MGYLKEHFLKFLVKTYKENQYPRGGVKFDPRAFIWTHLVDTPEDVSCLISKL